MKLVERILPWYKPEEQDERGKRINDLAIRAQTTDCRAMVAQDRFAMVVQSYQRTQERLCKH